MTALLAKLNGKKTPKLMLEHGTAKLSPRQVWDANKAEIRKMPADRVASGNFRFKAEIESQINEIQRRLG